MLYHNYIIITLAGSAFVMLWFALNSFAATGHLMKWMELKWHGIKWKFEMFWRVLKIWSTFNQKFTCWRHWNTKTSSNCTIHGWTPKQKMWTSSLRYLPLAVWGSKYWCSYKICLASAETLLRVMWGVLVFDTLLRKVFGVQVLHYDLEWTVWIFCSYETPCIYANSCMPHKKTLIWPFCMTGSWLICFSLTGLKCHLQFLFVLKAFHNVLLL